MEIQSIGRTREYRAFELKHNLKLEARKLKERKLQYERKRINQQFINNPKAVYINFKTETFEESYHPAKEYVQKFWSGKWAASVDHKEGDQWLNHVEDKYYADVNQKHDEASTAKVHEVVSKLKQNSAPGKDLITIYWAKPSTSLIP